MSAKIGRNDPCPCGSGKKYKNCCEKHGLKIRSKKTNKLLLAFGLLLGLAAVSTAYVGVSADNNSEASAAQSSKPKIDFKVTPSNSYPTPQTARRLYPEPQGPRPEGKVWSAEHGHWHDLANPTEEPNANGQPSTVALDNHLGGDGQYYPPPEGPAPDGKVWSTEHGHWHTVSEEQAQHSGKLVPQPPGPAPPGKTWSPEHGHWHGPPTDEELKSDPVFLKQIEDAKAEMKEVVKQKNQNPVPLKQEPAAPEKKTPETPTSDGN